MSVIKVNNQEIDADVRKFSENPEYYGIGFQVGTKEWKILKNGDYVFYNGKKYKIKQHLDVGDYTWFLFTMI